MKPTDQTRRTFVKRGAYIAPAILTLPATPSYAKAGSVKPEKEKGKNKQFKSFKG